MNKKDIKSINPQELGWLEYKLNSQEMDYVWRCIENKKGDEKSKLVGHVSQSYKLIDRGNWFYINTLKPLIMEYGNEWRNRGRNFPTNTQHPYYLSKWWVNYQKQTEFNPIHNHAGVYSFVIWMKIPFKWEEQNKKDIGRKSNESQISNFQFVYPNILGELEYHKYQLSSHHEGTMLFFPSQLNHEVYPFYDCDEDRISVSGNLGINTTTQVL